MIRIVRDRSRERELLLTPPARLSPRELNALTPSQRLDRLCAARGKEKLDLLVDAVDGAQLAARLPNQEFYLLLRELGPGELAELIPFATGEQLVTCLDLDGWRGDALDGAAVREWLELVLVCDEERVAQIAAELDFDLLVAVLKTQLRILRAPGDIEDEDLRLEAMRHNGGYEVEYLDPEHNEAIVAFLDILLRQNHDLFREALEAARWESTVELVEEVYRLRCGRLLELGFPDPVAARAVYARIEPQRFVELARRRRNRIDYGDEPLPAYGVLELARPGGLLAALLEHGIDEEGADALIMLLNKVLTADGVDVGNAEEVRTAAEECYGLLNLGLEFHCGADLAAAAAAFAAYHPEEFFRLGFTLTLDLQRRARALAESAAAALLDEPYAAVLDALLQPRPAFAIAIERPGRAGERHFAAYRDLVAVERRLDAIAAQLDFFTAGAPFPVPSPQRPADLTLATLLLTAFANRVLGRDFGPAPLSREDLAQLHARLCRDGELVPQARGDLLASTGAAAAGLAPFCDWALGRLEDEFCPLAGDEIDPQYLDIFITAT